ncbi:mitochondrial enolase superfamily member 1 [Eurytemora carolleeae]|uniref:mitochondrial enolase superfamily member 1 n=1 Tax=Eurytemora carolleeae TaxID=1294199 RepID=UPI000C767D40|nr:mitochondrial enolase superfamily member 1 [Eurytemora carolleeae]|eukprot:XP_023331590.1 mitochondrial enolase superfamily member 1-like [Eurytemora affinis]
MDKFDDIITDLTVEDKMDKFDDIITELTVEDIRFPTSLELDGSDALHPSPDYSACYIILTTARGEKGYGLTFTLGRGNEIVAHCIDSLRFLFLGQNLKEIFSNMGSWLYKVNNEGQLRWLGPEKGVIGLSMGGLVNALWDLRGRIEKKPVWKILVDMEPEEIINLIDFTYIEDCITREEAKSLLLKFKPEREEREKKILEVGVHAYTTAVGWLGYSDQKIRLVVYFEYVFETFFTILYNSSWLVGILRSEDKVSRLIENRRCEVLRDCIGPNNYMMVDANQKWGTQEAISWMGQLARFNPIWIEEPTSADDIQAHADISKALKPMNIGVATGEACQNRVMFKQFLMSGGMQFCQVDSARMSGLNEVLAVYLMATKLGIPVCPHAGGVGLCEMVQHLQTFYLISLSPETEGRSF